jgi:hypothetical protein
MDLRRPLQATTRHLRGHESFQPGADRRLCAEPARSNITRHSTFAADAVQIDWIRFLFVKVVRSEPSYFINLTRTLRATIGVC